MEPYELRERMSRLKGEPATQRQCTYIVMLLNDHGISDEERHSIMAYLIGKDSTKDLNKPQASLFIELLLTDSSFDPRSIVTERLKEQGQLELF